MLIQHNPNEGLKHVHEVALSLDGVVLIQHNPNEGLKQAHPAFRLRLQLRCSFSTTRTRD